jgi:hypothetical protein
MGRPGTNPPLPAPDFPQQMTGSSERSGRPSSSSRRSARAGFSMAHRGRSGARLPAAGSLASDHAILDVFGVGCVPHLRGVDLQFDRRLQVGSRGDRLGGELVDGVILGQYAHRRDEKP